MAKLDMFGTKFEVLDFEEFIHIGESETRFIYAWRIIPNNKIVEKRLANWSF